MTPYGYQLYYGAASKAGVEAVAGCWPAVVPADWTWGLAQLTNCESAHWHLVCASS